jgi:hypothetical protein
VSDPIVNVGEAVAGQAAQLRKKINALIKGMNANTFDLVEGLHEMKNKKHYGTLGFGSFAEYGKSIDLKLTKVYYLAKIGEVMSACGISRTEYEPIGIAKLRVITKLEPLDKDGKLATCTIEGEAWTVVEAIQAIAADAVTTDIEQIEEQVKRIQGKTGDDAEEWLNFKVKRIVKDAVIKPALEKCKLVIGTVAEDEDGMAIEPSDSAALEGLAAYYLSDATIGGKQ